MHRMVEEVPYGREARARIIRVRRVQVFTGAHSRCTTLRDIASRSGVQRKGRTQPAQARPEAEERFPRPWRLEDFFTSPLLPNQGFVGKPLAHDLRKSDLETVKVSLVFPVVIPECLFVHVAEQVEWL